jgi:hypothetical protein
MGCRKNFEGAVTFIKDLHDFLFKFSETFRKAAIIYPDRAHGQGII